MAAKARKKAGTRERRSGDSQKGKSAKQAAKASAARKSKKKTSKRPSKVSKRVAGGGTSAKTTRTEKVSSSPAAASRKPRRKRASGKRGKARPASKSSLTARQLRHFKELLLHKQQEMTRSYYEARGKSQDDLDSGTEDYIDYAVHSYERDFLFSLTELERKNLRLVEEALQRIELGEYGLCLHCGEAIHPRRLENVPWARYCVRCQELDEKGLLPTRPVEEEEETSSEAEGEGSAEDLDEGDYEGELDLEEEEEESEDSEPDLEDGLLIQTDED